MREKEREIIFDDVEIIEGFRLSTTTEYRKLNEEFKGLKKDKKEDELKGELDASVYVLTKLQSQSEVLDRVYEKAIIERNMDEAAEIAKASGLVKKEDLNPNPMKLLEILKDKIKEVTENTLGEIRVLRALEAYIEDYPLYAIEVEFPSITPKVKLQFRHKESIK